MSAERQKRVLMHSLLALVALASASLASPTAETVRVAICQMRVEDGKISENLARAESLVRKAKDGGARICVFPELIDVGFGPIVKSTSQTRLAAPIPGKITSLKERTAP
ncbi:MAG: nitrilase-related carbon-nitrogen hydrolase [Pirellulales bacterium]